MAFFKVKAINFYKISDDLFHQTALIKHIMINDNTNEESGDKLMEGSVENHVSRVFNGSSIKVRLFSIKMQSLLNPTSASKRALLPARRYMGVSGVIKKEATMANK